MSDLYNVIFNGELNPETELAEVKRRLGLMLKTEPRQIEQLFNNAPLAVKKNLNKRDARRYKIAFAKAGLHTDIETVIAEPEDEALAFVNNAGSVTTGHIVIAKVFACPACGCEQLEALDCARCGTVFEEYRVLQKRLIKHQSDQAQQQNNQLRQQKHTVYAQQNAAQRVAIDIAEVGHDQSHWRYAAPLIRMLGSLIDGFLIAGLLLLTVVVIGGFSDLINLIIALVMGNPEQVTTSWALFSGAAIGNMRDYSPVAGAEGALALALSAAMLLLYWLDHPQTIGMRWNHIAVVDETSGEVPSRKQMLIRTLALIVSILPLGVGFFFCIWDKNNQAWHDKLAGTAVIST